MAKNLCAVNSFKGLLNEQLEEIRSKCGHSTGSRRKKASAKDAVALPTANTITVYKLEGCPHSIAAGQTVDPMKNGRSFYISDDLKVGKEGIKKILAEKTKLNPHASTTFPIVFMGLEPIGGNAELQRQLATGKTPQSGGRRRTTTKGSRRPRKTSTQKGRVHKRKNK